MIAKLWHGYGGWRDKDVWLQKDEGTGFSAAKDERHVTREHCLLPIDIHFSTCTLNGLICHHQALDSIGRGWTSLTKGLEFEL